MNAFLESLGWLGAALVLGAYGLLSMKKLRAESYTYHSMNIVGAALLGFYAVWKSAWASLFINGTWAVIGACAVLALWRKRQKS